MNYPDSTGLIFNRIEVRFPPEYIKKVMGYLGYQVPDKQEMSHLGLSPDESIQDVLSVSAAHVDHPSPISLPVTYPREAYDPLQFDHSHVRSPSQQLYAKQQPELAVPVGYLEHRDQSPNQLLTMDDRVENTVLGAVDCPVNYFYPNDFERQSNVRIISQRHLNNSERPTKICHFFSRGYCRHGSDCRFLHVQASSNEFPSMGDGVHNDQIFLPGLLQKLELEIVEILKSWRGNPLSIASLPTIYYETYRKVLQAEGYLTESQRQGKAGHSLASLLSRLSSIRLIDRPHGQHAVVLAEDAMKYLEGQDEATSMNSKLRQIYLTFRAESTFTAEDVSKYFSTYGPVVDVRIPCPHKRMFGFVTFIHPETVQTILAKGNPHYICGAEVLVKRYKERSKLIDSKYQERTGFRTQPYIDANSELRSVPTRADTLRFLQHQRLMEENAKAIEIEQRYLTQLLLTRRHYQQMQMQMPYLANYMDALQVTDGHFNVPSASSHNHLADVPNRSSAEGERSLLKETAISNQESDLPNDLPRLLPACVIDSLKKQDQQSDTAEEMLGN